MAQLKKAIRRGWTEVTLNHIVNSIRSMPHRLKLVIEGKGHKIRY